MVSNVFLAAVVEVPECLKTVALKQLLYMCHRVIACRFCVFFAVTQSKKFMFEYVCECTCKSEINSWVHSDIACSFPLRKKVLVVAY